MIIELPKIFSFPDDTRFKTAWVENGILYIRIRSNPNFTQVMYSLTYKMKGKTRCFYCGREISKEERTIDHKYPKHYGGPTITNNLVPACYECNVEKSSMNCEEYSIYKELSKRKREKFRKSIAQKKEEICKTVGFDFPQEYVSNIPLCEIQASPYLEHLRGKKYRDMEKHYQLYRTFKTPIITDANLYLLKGYHVYLYAIENNIAEVPVIVLENVEVIYKDD